jgi:hypothetical protein
MGGMRHKPEANVSWEVRGKSPKMCSGERKLCSVLVCSIVCGEKGGRMVTLVLLFSLSERGGFHHTPIRAPDKARETLVGGGRRQEETGQVGGGGGGGGGAEVINDLKRQANSLSLAASSHGLHTNNILL